jgi:hypothetical protein
MVQDLAILNSRIARMLTILLNSDFLFSAHREFILSTVEGPLTAYHS